ncbi:DUF1190 domain-containing protein [Frateuria sp. MAH-13]|uniref:DUF1190 domain-containing protein n=1 Tax=Frateuria flava TaxID=2821489 RepID=A0ABS4DK51_9GAMM|nr:DUF1190 domain-containing protein [Frateuria flava]MBP1473425.1 DUF1190 domain-containing protein [Frateuria flava]
MKRSSHLRLTLMAATLPAALAGCDTGPATGTVLRSVDDCPTVKDVPTAQCQAAYQTALAEHQRLAPRFHDWNDCYQQFGACSPVVNDGVVSYYVPPMAGFLLGYAAARRNDDRGYAYSYSGHSIPLYRDRSGDFYKPSGDYVSGRSGTVKGNAGHATAPTRAITVSRSGFGSSSAARSSFGRGGHGGHFGHGG